MPGIDMSWPPWSGLGTGLPQLVSQPDSCLISGSCAALIAVASCFTSAVSALRTAISAICTACWWCGIICDANATSASLNSPVLRVVGAGVVALMPGIDPGSASLPQPDSPTAAVMIKVAVATVDRLTCFIGVVLDVEGDCGSVLGDRARRSVRSPQAGGPRSAVRTTSTETEWSKGVSDRRAPDAQRARPAGSADGPANCAAPAGAPGARATRSTSPGRRRPGA